MIITFYLKSNLQGANQQHPNDGSITYNHVFKDVKFKMRSRYNKNA
jgi:hypothetical protein